MEFIELQRPAHVMQAPLQPAMLSRLCDALLGEPQQAVQRLEGGNFNTLYRIQLSSGRTVVLRAAPGLDSPLLRHEQFLLRRQCAVQPALQALGAVVPALLAQDFSQNHLPRDVAVFAHAEGTRWDLLAPQLNAADQASLWLQYGALVAQLHALPGTAFGFPLAPQESYSEHICELLHSLQQDLQQRGLMDADTTSFVRCVTEQAERFDAVRRPCLVHGDLWQRNVLVARRSSGPVITALLDAERAFWGEAGSEWIFGFLDMPGAFWQGYGKDLSTQSLRGEALWRRRVYQGRGALQLILDAQRFGFDGSLARRQLKRCIEQVKSPASYWRRTPPPTQRTRQSP